MAAEEHGARAFEGDEAMDNLRARTRTVAVSGRALRLSLASHPDLPSTFIKPYGLWFTGLALGLIKL